MKRKVNLTKFITATFLITGGILVFWFDRQQESEISSSFSDEPVKIVSFENIVIPEEDKPKRLLIPNLGIDLEVKESEVRGGYWQVYDSVVGWGEGSSPPGYQGNQVLFAHAREGLFGNLDKVKLEDKIYIFNQDKWYSYTVKEIKDVYPGETKVIEQTEDERLTLYTCSGFRDEKRLVVVAKRD